MSHTVDHHRAVVDPFSRGHLATQIGYMMHSTRGRAFPWREGGVALLRRHVYPSLGHWQPCGLAVGADAQLRNYPGMGHSVSQAYYYTAVAFLGNGMISSVAEPVRLDFDANGTLIQPLLPNPPRNLCAKPIDGGKFALIWQYISFGHGAYPADFQVFEGSDAATVDFNTPLVDSVTALNKVVFVGNQRVYRFTTGAFGDNTPHVFVARARNAAGVAERNTDASAATKARNVIPADVSTPLSARVLHHSRTGMRD